MTAHRPFLLLFVACTFSSIAFAAPGAVSTKSYNSSS